MQVKVADALDRAFAGSLPAPDTHLTSTQVVVRTLRDCSVSPPIRVLTLPIVRG